MYELLSREEVFELSHVTGEVCAECEGSRLYRDTCGSVVSIATRYGADGPGFETH